MRFITVFLAVLVTASAKRSYEGYGVFDVYPETKKMCMALRALDMFAAFVPQDDTHMIQWQPECVVPGHMCQAAVHPSKVTEFLDAMKIYNVSFTRHSLDLQQQIDNERRRIDKYRQSFDLNAQRSLQDPNPWDLEFHTYAETRAWMDRIVATHPFVRQVSYGFSFEGREMVGLVLGLNPTAPKYMFNGAHHAREWLSPATVQYMVNQLVDGFDRGDQEIITLLNRLEWHILPLFNVDGFEYTWTNDRLWRKTRRPNPGSTCVGTDPNRNADANFGGPGTSSDPCSQTFCGPSPFSEVEVANVAQYALNLTNLHGYNDIHTSAQLLLQPWGYTSQIPAEEPDHSRMHEAAENAIFEVNGAHYPYGPTYNLIYPASGIIADYIFDEGVKYSMSWELRGGGFAPPPSFIITSGREIWEGTKVMANWIADEFS